jgi:short-subunit dehydrogenase
MKKIIITGTSRGIGHELALQFAQAGHQVLALSRTIAPNLLGKQNITCLSVDLSNEDDLIQVTNFLSSTWATVDAIVHNAGSLLLKPFLSRLLLKNSKTYIKSMFLALPILLVFA